MARGVGRWAIERRACATENHPAGEWEVAPLGRFGTREKAQRVIDRIVVPHDDMHDFRAREIGGAGGAESRKTVQVLLRVSPAARDAIDRVAERRGLDRSATLAALAIEADAAGRLPPPRHRRPAVRLVPVRRRLVQRHGDAGLLVDRGAVRVPVHEDHDLAAGQDGVAEVVRGDVAGHGSGGHT